MTRTPYGPMPTALEALRALADEFDRYSDELAAIGRGHSDYGCERRFARIVLADAERKGLARLEDALGALDTMQCRSCGFTGDDVQDFISTETLGERTCPRCKSRECYMAPHPLAPGPLTFAMAPVIAKLSDTMDPDNAAEMVRSLAVEIWNARGAADIDQVTNAVDEWVRAGAGTYDELQAVVEQAIKEVGPLVDADRAIQAHFERLQKYHGELLGRAVKIEGDVGDE